VRMVAGERLKKCRVNDILIVTISLCLAWGDNESNINNAIANIYFLMLWKHDTNLHLK
jgi:hypothetical protein